MMRLFDTKSGHLVDLEVPRDRPLTIYVCGPTVYDVPHIGNARPAIVFDALVRTLRRETEVIHASNFTDVDDKIITRAVERGITIEQLCDETIAAYQSSMDGLGIAPPDIRPRATQSIGAMIAMIETLVEKGLAYEAEGHVLFDGTKAAPILRAAGDSEYARIEPASYKRDPSDFVLWKPEWHGVGWDSPWGKGRPGWHIECSAMIREHLGETIDIHCGGLDLVMPHHEAECQQSHGANGAPLARVWMHNGMVMVEGRKMSKSDGNFITVDDILERPQGAESLRMSMLMTHYTQPYDFTRAKLRDAQHFYNLLMDRATQGTEPHLPFVEMLHSAFNTPRALQTLASAPSDTILPSLALLGFEPRPESELTSEETALVNLRSEARKNKDWDQSDALREELHGRGIALEDEALGTTWKRIIPSVFET